MTSKTIRLPKPPDPFHREIQARIAAKRAAGKREPVQPTSQAASSLRALAASIRATAGVISGALMEGR